MIVMKCLCFEIIVEVDLVNRVLSILIFFLLKREFID